MVLLHPSPVNIKKKEKEREKRNLENISRHLGSYANSYKQHQRRLQDEKQGRKSVMSEYKNFVQNSGFGPAFNGIDHHRSYEDKV